MQSRSWLGEMPLFGGVIIIFPPIRRTVARTLPEDTAMNTKDRVLASLIRDGVASSTRVTRRADETPRVRKERWRGDAREDAKYALHSFSSPSSNVSLPARLAFSCVPSSVKFRNFPWPLKNTCALGVPQAATLRRQLLPLVDSGEATFAPALENFSGEVALRVMILTRRALKNHTAKLTTNVHVYRNVAPRLGRET